MDSSHTGKTRLNCPKHPDKILKRLYYWGKGKVRIYTSWYFCEDCNIPQKLEFEAKTPEQVEQEVSTL